MRVTTLENYEAASRAASAAMAEEFALNPRLLLCLATGATPARAYELIAAKRQKSPSLLSQLRVLKLDEWAGLAAPDPGSCEVFLRQRVVAPWGISPARFEGFACHPRPPKLECERIRKWLASHGPIDVCVLGLGLNGHLGFNEPGPTLCPVAHVAALAEETRKHPMLGPGAAKPEHGLTLGMAEILQSRRIFLLVSGQHKRPALRRLLSGEITTEFPASFLWLHPQTTLFCDRDSVGAQGRKKL